MFKVCKIAIIMLFLCEMAFSENRNYGLDVVFGATFGKSKIEYDSSYGDITVKLNEIGFPYFLPTKIATYDCFLFNNHFGVYASVGMSAIAAKEKDQNGEGSFFGFDFMVGPAFGINLGKSPIRFQTGIAFHACFTKFFLSDYFLVYSGFGIGVTPQFRFLPNKRLSVILGCDLLFDFIKMPINIRVWNKSNSYSYYSYYEEETVDSKKGLRFAAVPCIGMGINF